MEFRNTLSILKANTETIVQFIEQLEKSDKLRTIDLDLLLGKLRDVYDIVFEIRNSEWSENKVSESTANEQDEFIREDLAGEVENEKMQEVKKQIPGQAHETSPSTKQETKRNLQQRDQEEKIQEIPESNALIADRFITDSKTLNEEIGVKSGNADLASQLKSSHLNSISSGIGLNEKFELINELFDGNKAEFEKVIEILNMAGSVEEARRFLEENHNWEMNNPYVQRILELVQRKLTTANG
jgi:hypothetical protein